jgi:hypothetical protein
VTSAVPGYAQASLCALPTRHPPAR